MEGITIRDCLESDIDSVHRIYVYYVETSVCTYEEEIPSVDEIRRRWALIKSKQMPFIIAELQSSVDQPKVIVGYAYLSTYRERSGWRFCVENSVYLDHSFHGRGIGKLLMNELIEKCKNETPFTEIIAISLVYITSVLKWVHISVISFSVSKNRLSPLRPCHIAK